MEIMIGDHRVVLNDISPSQYVKINVGGSLHYTTIDTLTKHDNVLKEMFSGQIEVLTDSDGWIIINRDGKHFGTLLNYLRGNAIYLPDSQQDVVELLNEAKYYNITGLVKYCEDVLQRNLSTENICKFVAFVDSPSQEAALLSSATKPVVKLLVNRHNNKYSYISNSDDNFLKNIELFDKLSIKYSDRILFVRDIYDSNEICMWGFFGHGKKIGEICCTSIVYYSDRKQTKVDFPESRIYEETLNTLLYENIPCSSKQLVQITSPPSVPEDNEDGICCKLKDI